MEKIAQHLVSEVKSALSWLVPLSFVTFALGRWTFVHTEKPVPPQHLKFFRRRREAMRAEKEYEDRIKPKFRFEDLPAEVRLAILERCAPVPSKRKSIQTFLSLLPVSRRMQREAYVACMPLVPVALWTKKGVRSFSILLRHRPELGSFVRYMWIGTGKYDDEEIFLAAEILRKCTQLRSLACTELVLSKVVKWGALSNACQRLTLMNMEKDAQYEVVGVTELRMCAGTLSTGARFPNVTSLSVNVRRKNSGNEEKLQEECINAEKWPEVFASVQTIALVGRDFQRPSSKGLGAKAVRKKTNLEMFSVIIPAKWTEWDIWSADTVGAGIWDHAF